MGLFSTDNKRKVIWQEITSLEELQVAFEGSKNKISVFFKHSTRCPISRMALNRFENQWQENEKFNLFYIDLLSYREVSNELANLSNIVHQSPQVIVLKDKQVLYNQSHNSISAEEVMQLI